MTNVINSALLEGKLLAIRQGYKVENLTSSHKTYVLFLRQTFYQN